MGSKFSIKLSYSHLFNFGEFVVQGAVVLINVTAEL